MRTENHTIAFVLAIVASVNSQRLADLGQIRNDLPFARLSSMGSQVERQHLEPQPPQANRHMLKAILLAHSAISPARFRLRPSQVGSLRSRFPIQMQESPPTEEESTPVAVPKKVPKRKPTATGLFAPLVVGAKRAMGDKELNKLRAEVIKKHSKVIADFVDTSESKFGQIVLKRMFEAADKDKSGALDREEVKEALNALGFTFVQDKDVDKIMQKADLDENDVIDFEEFVKETPVVLRRNLIQLAKANGHDLGFLA